VRHGGLYALINRLWVKCYSRATRWLFFFYFVEPLKGIK
jgi:hypothetical protein